MITEVPIIYYYNLPVRGRRISQYLARLFSLQGFKPSQGQELYITVDK